MFTWLFPGPTMPGLAITGSLPQQMCDATVFRLKFSQAIPWVAAGLSGPQRQEQRGVHVAHAVQSQDHQPKQT